MRITRRTLLTGSLAGAALMTAPVAIRLARPEADRSISFFVPATGERDTVTFWSAGEYLADGIAAANRILRDFKTETLGSVDVGLLDVMHAMMTGYGEKRELEIVRGHIANDPAKPLAAGSPNAFHNSGQALDVRVRGVTLEHLAMDFIRWVDGGVGMYPKSDFVHLDIGPHRRWTA